MTKANRQSNGIQQTAAFLLILYLSTLCQAQYLSFLRYLSLDDRQIILEGEISTAIYINEGIPFGTRRPLLAWVSTYGLLSFGEPYSDYTPEIFPGVSHNVQNRLLIAPFWDHIDISTGSGIISYQTFSSSDSDTLTIENFNSVNSYVNSVHGQGDFAGAWMLVAYWNQVSPYDYFQYSTDFMENNTFQVILITDHNSKTYTIFTFYCGDLNWAYGPTIGYNAASEQFSNYPGSGTTDADTIDCTNGPNTYYNVWYNISVENFIVQPTNEPAQASYLQWLEHTGVNAGVVAPCDDCSSEEIMLPVSVPFGNYNHSSLYVSTNGVFSFEEEFPHYSPSVFPTNAATYNSYVVAPYWVDNDARLNGQVSWEMYETGESSATDDVIDRVNTFINMNTNETGFVGNFMFVGFWEEMHPYPAGQSPIHTENNTVQGLIITNGTKTYAVFTYKCNFLSWSGQAVIGFNAGGDYYDNHPLSGLDTAHLVACVHQMNGSEWNNVIYDLVPSPDELSVDETTPQNASFGTCVEAGYSECCEDTTCLGMPQDCFCDGYCYFLDDCCRDISETCIFEPPPDTDYLLLASGANIIRMHFDGSNVSNVHAQLSGEVVGIDYHFRAGKMFWSWIYINDSEETYTIHMSDLSGDNLETLVNTDDIPADIAVDWINDKLYWADLNGPIEVMDITTGSKREKTEVIKFSGYIPYIIGIAVDPNSRLLFWSGLEDFPKIERAAMDGTNRVAILNTNTDFPYGITIDYASKRVYWAAYNYYIDESKIEFSDYYGNGRSVLVDAADDVIHPFAVTIYGNLIYWTDWGTLSVYGTHKTQNGTQFQGGTLVTEVFVGESGTLDGIEAVSPTRQQDGANPCAGNPCQYMCLLSTNPQNYSCACPLNSTLNDDGTTCSGYISLSLLQRLKCVVKTDNES